MTDEKNLWLTRDLTLAATLITLAFPLVKIDYQIEGSRQQPVGYFGFDDTEDRQKSEREFLSKKLMVEPREFMENIRHLKSQITNIYKSPHSPYAKLQEEQEASEKPAE